MFSHGLDLSVFPVGKNLANQCVRRCALGLLLPFGFAIGFAGELGQRVERAENKAGAVDEEKMHGVGESRLGPGL